MRGLWLIILLIGSGYSVSAGQDAPAGNAIRIGYFPNITHAQALYARASGAFAKRLGKPIEWTAFNAGPTAIEALFTDQIDAAYVGPGPAINGFVRSHGEKFIIVSGSAIGGAALVVRPGAGIDSDRDFNGKTLATPQLGNTQDIAARIWLAEHGYRTTVQGGTVNLVPLSNPDQLTMFREKQIDAAWTIEPWVSRLVLEAGGSVYFEEKSLWPRGDYATTILVVTRPFLHDRREDVLNLLRAHVDVTQILQSNSMPAVLNQQIKEETGRALPPKVIERALANVRLTWEPAAASIRQYANWAEEIHFLRAKPDLRGLYDLTLLNQALAERGLPAIHD